MNLNNITNTGTWGEQATKLNDNFNKVALGIDTLQEMYKSLSQSEIEVVATLPQTGEANKIYRLVGTTSYTDYMYNADDLTTPIPMATYNNAIDDEPTAGSENLVKSGGVESSIAAAEQRINARFPNTEEDGFFVVDENENVGMKYDEEGLDFAKISQHAIEVLKSKELGGSSNTATVQEDGFFVVDEELNIGMAVDNDGLHAKNILEYEIVEL